MRISLSPPVLTMALMVVFYAVGIVGHAVPATLPWMLSLTPWFLLLAGGAVGFVYARDCDLGSLTKWFFPVLIATFLLEALGVATGLVFGPYYYTTVLGAHLLGVPPVIGLNWVLVVLGAVTAMRNLIPRVPAVVRVVAVGLLCVAFDLLLEPVAIGLRYWVWPDNTVPLQNYVAWGCIAALGAWWAERFPSLSSHPLLAWYAVLQAVFFLLLHLLGVRA